MASDSSDLADDIIPDELPRHGDVPRDTFFPWHKVRKQFVRQNQWNKLAVRMVEEEWQQDLEQVDAGTVTLANPLRCLVIPGDDLLDIRSLYKALKNHKCAVRYLGFHEGQGSNELGTRVHIANNAVTSLEMVARDSQVIRDRFQAIANEDSQAYRLLREYGPYHVVNLDFCGSMFPNTTSDPQEHYRALHRLLDYQFAHQRSKWLLLLTTKVEPHLVSPPLLQKLCEPTRKNYDTHTDFADLLLKFVPLESFAGDPATIDLSLLAPQQLVQLFGVALGKWILSLCQKAEPHWSVRMRGSFKYTIDPASGTVILSLAFVLEPSFPPLVDETGISTLKPAGRAGADEKICAMKIAEKIGDMLDVDELLANNPAEQKALRDAHAELLEEAGYNRAAYLKWVAEGEKTD